MCVYICIYILYIHISMYVQNIYAYIYTHIYICKTLNYMVYTVCLCVYTRVHAERKILRT